MISMPGSSYRGTLPPITQEQSASSRRMAAEIQELAGTIGERNLDTPKALEAAARYITARFEGAGYNVIPQEFSARGRKCRNLEVEIKGSEKPEEIIVIGGHYDSAIGCPAANDNASGATATIELARLFHGKKPARSLRFVAFVNEEPPYFQTELMGSLVYARRCRARDENIVAMLSLETMGCFSDEPGSQSYPFPFSLAYPSVGNFIGFVGNFSSRKLIRRVAGSFRQHANFPSEGLAGPAGLPGVGWSDHWSFWQVGYPALMVTDTAPFRFAHYHTAEDTPDKVDCDKLARVVRGLEAVISELSAGDS